MWIWIRNTGLFHTVGQVLIINILFVGGGVGQPRGDEGDGALHRGRRDSDTGAHARYK
jgi:hypothetical protein